ncbi:hypothetical protein T492DRAFT_24184 [Pavlovales sp. CCMP2436]|nr:hypothetical protein T492DRAFT_24184 [Pavlovales sp. CCMP2436]
MGLSELPAGLAPTSTSSSTAEAESAAAVKAKEDKTLVEAAPTASPAIGPAVLTAREAAPTASMGVKCPGISPVALDAVGRTARACPAASQSPGVIAPVALPSLAHTLAAAARSGKLAGAASVAAHTGFGGDAQGGFGGGAQEANREGEEGREGEGGEARRTVRSHRVLLCTLCPYFELMLAGRWCAAGRSRDSPSARSPSVRCTARPLSVRAR